MFERDSDQSNVPEGFEAFLLRAPGMLYKGRVTAVRVTNGLPHLIYEGDASAQPVAENVVSRVFVKLGAPIDPEVFQLVTNF